MGQRKFSIKDEGKVNPCPKCGNTLNFVGMSEQFSEDCCHVWVQCQCGYDPANGNSDHYIECTWGSLEEENLQAGLIIWQELTTQPESQSIDLLTEGELLPPPPNACQVCGVEHDEQQPHNAESLYYQYSFKNSITVGQLGLMP